MLVDNNGFLVYHPDANFQYKHLIQLEPEVADSLIALGHMQQAQCKDFAWKVEYYTWKVSINTDEDTRLPFYEIIDIEKTNIHLIVVNLELLQNIDTPTCSDCPSGVYGSERNVCENQQARHSCQCPCHNPLSYVSCENQFNEESNDYAICTSSVSHQFSCSQAIAPSTCYDVTCDLFGDEFECEYRVECNWCESSLECVEVQQECPDIVGPVLQDEKSAEKGTCKFS